MDSERRSGRPSGPSLPGELVRRKMGGLGRYKKSFFGKDENCDFAKVVKRLWILAEMEVGGEFSRKNKNRVKRTVRYHFEGVVVAKWQDEK